MSDYAPGGRTLIVGTAHDMRVTLAKFEDRRFDLVILPAFPGERVVYWELERVLKLGGVAKVRCEGQLHEVLRVVSS